MKSRFPVFLSALLLTGGCAPHVQLPAPQVAIPGRYEPSRQPGTDAGASLSWDRWWTGFDDPQLTSLVEGALARSTTIRLAYARLAEARALRSQARAGTGPTGSITASATGQGSERLWSGGASSAAHETYQANFFPSWELDLFGRLSAIRDRADLNYHASAFDFEAVRLSLAADVAASLFQARFLSAQLDTARENFNIAHRLAAAGALGLSRGLTSPQDAARLEADASTAAAEVTRLEAELQIAKRSLLILTGTPDAATTSLAISSRLGSPPEVPEVTPGTLLIRRPDVRAAELDVRAAAATVKIDRLALFPSFSIQPGLGLTASGGSAPVPGGTGLWSVAAGLVVPVLDRARLLAAMRASEARGQQAVIGYERAVQTAFGEAENALSRLFADKKRSIDLERAAAQSEIAFETARRGYQAGITDLTSLLQIQRTWLQARNARDTARLALLTDTVGAIRALGGGWDPERLATTSPQALPSSGTPR